MVKNEKMIDVEKKVFAESIIATGGSFLIHFDPRSSDTLIPENLKEPTRQALEFGLNLAVPIGNFTINDEGIGGSLSINRTPFFCWVPWNKVFCIVLSGTAMGKEWDESFPEDDELLQNSVIEKKRSQFKLIEGGVEDDDDLYKPTTKETSKAKLRLVK